MKDAAGIRVWTLLARVRQLRVERVRRLLNESRDALQRAAADTASRTQAIADHGARRRDILAACSFGERRASLWRVALQRHDAGKPALESALALASDVEQRARERVRSTLHVLQKEMRGLDYARDRRRSLIAARDDGDPED
jgi:hypothetical protein